MKSAAKVTSEEADLSGELFEWTGLLYSHTIVLPTSYISFFQTVKKVQ